MDGGTAGAIVPPATIGILGGGQLGRMLAVAARALGYRVVVLDPDPDCPARAVVDDVIVGAYDDVEAALRLAALADVVTVELEHIGPAVVDALERAGAERLRPNAGAIRATQHRLAERRFLDGIGAPVAPWREVRTRDELGVAVAALGGGVTRLKAALGGYDGRSQLRLGPNPGDAELDAAFEGLARSAATHGLLLEAEIAFERELSVVVGRLPSGESRPFPVAWNLHEAGILVESVVPAPVADEVATAAQALAVRIADALGMVGVMTAELFLAPDGTLLVNELAPRVHNSGHWSLDGAVTSQFEQHVRAICGLPLGAPDALTPTAMANLLGVGTRRPARLLGVERALSSGRTHLHLYGKREVFEGRKMGHVTAVARSWEEALGLARGAREALRWDEEGR